MNSYINNEGMPDWYLIGQQQWFKDMALCQQEPDYHAEGDVATHTKMVIDELTQLEEYSLLSAEDKEIVMLSCLFHDIAKPKCTILDPMTNRVSSPAHSKMGEKVLRELLWDTEFTKRKHICSLVRLHGLPVWSITKDNANKSVVLSSLRVNNNLLYLLAKSDMLGRISEYKEGLVLNVDLFKELCIDMGCLNSPVEFNNAHSKFKFYQSDTKYPVQLYDDTEFEVIILSGIAGSGKDTYAKTLDMPVLSLDSLRLKNKIKRGDKKAEGQMIQEAYGLARQYCRKKQSFVWNSTNLTYDMRAKIINTLAPYNPKFKIVYIETSLKNIYSRRQDTISTKDMTKMFRLVDIPLPYEAHEVQYLKNI